MPPIPHLLLLTIPRSPTLLLLPHKLSMPPQSNHIPPPPFPIHPINPHSSIPQTPTHPLRPALNLNRVAHPRTAQVAHIDVHAHPGPHPTVPRRNRHAPRPVHNRRAHAPVQTAPRVDVLRRKRQPCYHVPAAGVRDRQAREQEGVDGRGGDARRDLLVDVGEDDRV